MFAVVAVSAGVYNETVFRGVDYAIAQAARYNIKLILALGTYWEVHDGVIGVRFLLLLSIGLAFRWTSITAACNWIPGDVLMAPLGCCSHSIFYIPSCELTAHSDAWGLQAPTCCVVTLLPCLHSVSPLLSWHCQEICCTHCTPDQRIQQRILCSLQTLHDLTCTQSRYTPLPVTCSTSSGPTCRATTPSSHRPQLPVCTRDTSTQCDTSECAATHMAAP